MYYIPSITNSTFKRHAADRANLSESSIFLRDKLLTAPKKCAIILPLSIKLPLTAVTPQAKIF